MTKKQLIILVRKYLKGKANDAERTFVEAWYQEAHSGSSIETILTSAEVQALEEQVFANIEARINAPVRLKKVTSVIAYLRPVAAAACIALVLGASWMAYQHFSNHSAYYTELYSKPGQVQKVMLSDGSVVWLNADSRMRFPKAFGRKGPREIFLEGEAYFEVAKDLQHPFVVHSSDVTTHVLGTRFNVKAYRGSSGVEVTLLEGKVMLTAPLAGDAAKKQDTLYLAPDQKAFFPGSMMKRYAAQPVKTTHDSGLTTRTATVTPVLEKKDITNAQGSAAWRNGELVFDQEPLSSVIASLSRKYDIQVKADPLLLDEHVTASLYNMTAEEALLAVTRQLKRRSGSKSGPGEEEVQFKKEGNVFAIE